MSACRRNRQGFLPWSRVAALATGEDRPAPDLTAGRGLDGWHDDVNQALHVILPDCCRFGVGNVDVGGHDYDQMPLRHDLDPLSTEPERVKGQSHINIS
jgi:hypothetical protein